MASETLRIELRVDGAAAAVTDTKRVETGIITLSGTAQRATEQFRGLGVILGGLATGAFAALIKGTIDSADELSKLSTRLGTSIEGLSQMQFAAERSGVGIDAMATALQRQTRRIAEAAQGTGEAIKAFQELGLSAGRLTELSPERQFLVLSEALAGVADAGDRVRLAMKFWDSEGVRMLQIADGGAAAVQALWQESDRLGRTMDQETAVAAAKLNDSIRNLQGTMESWAQGIARAVIPILDDLATSLTHNLIPALTLTAKRLSGLGAAAALSADEVRIRMHDMRRQMDDQLQQIEALNAKAEQLEGSSNRRTRAQAARVRQQAEEARREYASMQETWQQLSDRQQDLAALMGKVDIKLSDYSDTLDEYGGNLEALKNRVKELLDSIDPARKATEKFQQAQALLSLAVKAGIVTQKEADAALKKLSDSSDNGTKSFGRLSKATKEVQDTMSGWERTLMDVNASAEELFAALDAQEIERINEAWSKAQFEVPKAAREASRAASQEIRTEIGGTADWMAQSLTDALLRGFEDGKGFVQNFIDTLKNWFSTLVLRPIIQPIAASTIGALGLGSTGQASAGGSPLSSLYGMGGGSSISSALNTGARYLGWNPAGAAGPTQLFGGTGLGYGLAGFGGGLIGQQLGGTTASSIGGSLGGMVGYGLATGSAFAGTALGAQLGMFAGPIGMAVGALVGTLIGKLISGKGGDKSPDLQVFATDLGPESSNIKTTSSGGVNLRDWIVQSAFGNFGIRTKHDAFKNEEDASTFAAALTGVGTVETSLANLVGPDTTARIAEAIGELMGEGIRKLAEDPKEWESGLEQFLEERFTAAFDIIGGNMERVFQSITGNAADAAQATVGLFTALQSLRDASSIYADLVEQQNRTLFETQQLHAEGLRQLIAGYQGGLEATQDLTAALSEQAQLQIQVIGQIDQVISDIQGTLGGTIESLTLRLFDSDAQRYDYLRGQAEALAASLSGITDPQQLRDTVNQINTLTQQGIGLLSEEQLQAGMGQGLVDFLSQVQDISIAQAEQTRDTVAQQAELLSQQTDAAMAQLEASRQIASAAAQNASAVAAFGQAVGVFAAASSQNTRPSQLPASGAGALMPL